MDLSKLAIKILNEKVSTAFELALNEGSHREVVDPTRVSRLRISSFPFCPVQWFMGLPRNTGKARYATSSSRYFTQVGHVLHGVIQNALTNVGLDVHGIEVIADWKCKACKTIASIQVKPTTCKCGCEEFWYEEIAIERGIITGHIDTVLAITLRNYKELGLPQTVWIVIDYKTSSTFKVRAKDSKMPYIANVRQIGGYVGQLHEMGYPVVPLAYLIYVPRDNPWSYRLEPVAVNIEDEARRVKLYQKRFIRIAAVSTRDELIDVVDTRPCRKELLDDFHDCGHSGKCAGPDNRNTIIRSMAEVLVRVEKKLPIRKQET